MTCARPSGEEVAHAAKKMLEDSNSPRGRDMKGFNYAIRMARMDFCRQPVNICGIGLKPDLPNNNDLVGRASARNIPRYALQHTLAAEHLEHCIYRR